MTHIVHSSTETLATRKSVHIRRFVTDALAGFGLFALGSTLTSGSGALAATLNLAETNPSRLLLADPSIHPVAMLALVFSLLFAFNAAFFRHLSRAYSRAGRK